MAVTLPMSRIEPRVPESFGSCARIRRTTDPQTRAWVVRFSGERRVPALGVDAVDRAVAEAPAAAAGDGEEAVDPAELRHAGVDGGLDRGLVGQLRGAKRGAPAAAGDPLDELRDSGSRRAT